MTTENTANRPAITRVSGGRIAAGVVGLVALVLLGRQLGGLLPRFAEWVDGLGFWGPAVFIAGYVVTTIAFVPGAVMTLAAGAVFGLAKATVYVLTGATIGSAVAFLISRHLAREAIAARVAGNPRFAAIDRAVGAHGFKMVLLMRLSPVFPYNLLNYSLGLTTVRFTDYALASIGMLPGTLLYAYYGVLAGDVARLAGGTAVERGSAYYAVLVLGLIATIAVSTLVTRAARRALRDASGGEDGL
ncbi:MAG: TVP38/TMEM64 family protein [Acidobacteria bacterium]|nr:TVP38/TMEM64 family protein [Acidobacteriota bacterium]